MAAAMKALSPAKEPVSKKSRLESDGEDSDTSMPCMPPDAMEADANGAPGSLVSPQGLPGNSPPSDDDLPPWFSKMQIGFLNGVDTMFDSKLVPI